MLKSLGRRIAVVPTPVIFLGSILVAAVLLWQQGAIRDIGPAIRGADLSTILLAFALYLAGLALLCLRWHWLVQMVGGISRLAQASEAFLTSVALNYAAPLSLALPSRALLTKRALGLNAVQTTAVTFWEVISDLVVLAVLTLLWLLLGGWRIEIAAPPVWLILVSAVLLAGGTLAFLIAFRRVQRLRSIGDLFRRQVGTGLDFPRQRRLEAGIALALTAVFWVVQGGVLWLILDAIDGQPPDGLLVLGLIGLPMLVGMLSPVPGGAGIREAAMIAVASTYGANEASVLLAAVTYRIALFAAIPALFALIRLWTSLSSRFRGTIGGGQEDTKVGLPPEPDRISGERTLD